MPNLESQIVKYQVAREKKVYEMQEGEVFEYSTLGKVAFTRIKRGGKSFVATQLSTGQSYTCKNFDRSKVHNVIGLFSKPKPALPDDSRHLQKGDLFIISQRRDAVLLRFVNRTPSGKIRGQNPYTGDIFTLDKSFECTLVGNVSCTVQE